MKCLIHVTKSGMNDFPLTLEGWSIRLEAPSLRAAACERMWQLLREAKLNPSGEVFWVHAAEDEDWNKHPNGMPMSCRAFEMVFVPVSNNGVVGEQT